MTIDRNQLQSTLKKVDLYLSVQRFDAADKLLRSALIDFGPLANIYNYLGLTMHRQARFLEAVSEFRKALQVNPSYVEAALNLVVTLCDLSRYDEARQVFDAVQAQINPAKKQPDLILGRIANQHAELGHLYSESGMHSDAIREYRKALSVFERMPDVRMALVRALIQIGQIEKAHADLQEFIRQAKLPNSEAITLLGWLELKLGRPEVAREYWVKAQQTDPNDLISRAYLRMMVDRVQLPTLPNTEFRIST